MITKFQSGLKLSVDFHHGKGQHVPYTEQLQIEDEDVTIITSALNSEFIIMIKFSNNHESVI